MSEKYIVYADAVYEVVNFHDQCEAWMPDLLDPSSYAFKFSHISTSVGMTEQSMMFTALKIDNKGIAKHTGVAVTLRPDQLVKTEKKFERVQGINVKKYEMK